MRYTHNYSKLDHIEYTTIRRYVHGFKKGQTVTERYPSGTHEALIIDMKKKTLDSLSIDFLREDTDLNTREEIYELFESFYDKPINFKKDKFVVFYLRRLD